MQNEWRPVTETLRYLPAQSSPLSADVIGYFREGETWLYDVGASPEAAEAIRALPGRIYVVLSHFHPDHTANLSRISWDGLYVGRNTARYTKTGTVVDGPMLPAPGVRLAPLPSCHAKGSLLMEAEGYAFLGDGTYTGTHEGKRAYSVGQLGELIGVLKGLSSEYVLLSHRDPICRRKTELIEELTEVFQRRKPGEGWITPPL